jgi:hypothetical protein
MSNGHEIDPAGRPKVGWCFVPVGYLVAGDVMLAQKFALETNEFGALAVANTFLPKESPYLCPTELSWLGATSNEPALFCYGRISPQRQHSA